MDTVKIFVSYCHQNSDWVDDNGKYKLIPWLQNQLRRKNVLFWTDSVLQEHIGESFEKKIYENIKDSDIALLLITQEFSTSDFILDKELPWIRDEFVHNRIKIVPLLISEISKMGRSNIGWIFDLQTIPDDKKPIIDYFENDVSRNKILISLLDTLNDKILEISSKPNSKVPEQTVTDEKAIAEAKAKRIAEEKAAAEARAKRLIEEKAAEEARIKRLAEETAAEEARAKRIADEKDVLIVQNAEIVTKLEKGLELEDIVKNIIETVRNEQNSEKKKAEEEKEAAETTNAKEPDDIVQLRKAAEQGDADAQFQLAFMYYNGQGVNQNYSKAFEWFQKSAEQGNAAAQCYLGNSYFYGNGVNQNYSKAFEWFQKSAEQGDADAQYNLGVMYENGQGVNQNDYKAFGWYQKSAEQENADAQHNLGCMYYNGQGVVKDYSKAIYWFRKAAYQGHEEAEKMLEKIYH